MGKTDGELPMRFLPATAVWLSLAMVSMDLGEQGALTSPARWWQSVEVQRALGLTPGQVQNLDATFERGLSERIALRRKIAEMDRLLARIMERGNADDARAWKLSEQVETLRAQSNVRRTLMLFSMYRCLTRDQRATLSKLRTTTVSLSPPSSDRHEP